MEENQPQTNFSSRIPPEVLDFLRRKPVVISILVILIIGWLYFLLWRPPSYFPQGEIITVKSGESLQGITTDLRETHVISSPFIFRAIVIALGGERTIHAGDYFLPDRIGPLALARRLARGDFRLDVVKVTIPEGWNVFQIGDYLKAHLARFDQKKFLTLAGKQEGYLFPDTYFMTPTIQPEAVISLMRDNFDSKISALTGVATSTHSLREIITMASILEEEALPADRQIVAGILWKRIEKDMPLQVDSTFSYVNGKNSYNLTLDDLKIDSPYNTYIHLGLPPGPISNPGLDAIHAAMYPIASKYVYFLTQKDGTIHYAKTFEEHKANKIKYLNL